MYTASSSAKKAYSKEKGTGLSGKGRENFNLHTTRCTIGQPFSHHGDQVETLGKGLEGMKKRVERKCREQEHSKTMRQKVVLRGAGEKGRGKGGSEETRGGGEGVTGDEHMERRWGGEGQGLSMFDVKSLRQKHSRAECCSTCAGNPQCKRQHGDGEDEGGEVKTGT